MATYKKSKNDMLPELCIWIILKLSILSGSGKCYKYSTQSLTGMIFEDLVIVKRTNFPTNVWNNLRFVISNNTRK